VKAVEGDQQNANSWRERQDTLLAKCVRFKLPVNESSDASLVLLVAAIEGSEVEVGGRIRDAIVPAVGVEEICIRCISEMRATESGS